MLGEGGETKDVEAYCFCRSLVIPYMYLMIVKIEVYQPARECLVMSRSNSVCVHFLHLTCCTVSASVASLFREAVHNRQPRCCTNDVLLNGGNLQCAHCRIELNQRKVGAGRLAGRVLAGCRLYIHVSGWTLSGTPRGNRTRGAFQSEAQSWCAATAQHGGVAPPRS